jgi:hypothetical protein
VIRKLLLAPHRYCRYRRHRRRTTGLPTAATPRGAVQGFRWH